MRREREEWKGGGRRERRKEGEKEKTEKKEGQLMSICVMCHV